MPKKTELPHYGQILTRKAAIRGYISDNSDWVNRGLLYCIVNGMDDTQYQSVLHAACSKLWFLSKMVYRSKNGIVKLPIKTYETELFDGMLETEEEVADHLGYMKLDKSRSGYAYKCLQPIKQLLCHMIGCEAEQVFVSELVYAVDYVLRRNGEVEAPIFDRPCDLFPSNYKDFHYNEGIGKDILRIERLSL